LLVQRITLWWTNAVSFSFLQNEYTGDSQLTNAVYLDNAFMELYHARLGGRPNAIAIRLKWPGPEEPTVVAVERKSHHGTAKTAGDIDSFVLPEEDVIAFLSGQLKPEDAAKYWRAQVSKIVQQHEMMPLFDTYLQL